jgi:hypothetical protein
MNRIQSLFNWIGATIPEQVEIENKQIKLRKLVSDFITKSDVSDEDKENIRILIKALKKKSLELRQVISTQEISDHQAMELLDEITGILRAVDRLRNLTEDNEEEIYSGKEDLMRKIDDEKRWLKFTRSMK